jgi:selenocysteine lyase/cysteine desulfurase
MNRRDFGRLVALAGSAAVFPGRLEIEALPLGPTPDNPPDTINEAFWKDVRARFLVPRDVAFLNAANLCPTSLPVVEALDRNARAYEANPSPDVRSALMARGRETARAMLAAALHVAPEEVVITRNTTESNNAVSSGLDLKAGDEVVLWEDNHPSNLNAWRQKAARFGFTVVAVPVPPSHPGADGYVDLFTKAFTAKTKLVAVTHVSSNSGDVLPVADICAAARARGILSLVDGAQAFGVLDLDLSAIKPDFYSGSMHKWPCGPKEKGLLYVNKAVHDRIHPSVVGVYAGAVGISRTMESHGQRDDASVAAVTDALKFQETIGRATIERRARQLAQALMEGLKKLDGVTLWTDPNPARSSSIVIFRPGTLDPRKLNAALTNDRIVATARTGDHNPGLRLAPHFYNTMDDIDRTLAAIQKYIKSGV